MNEEDEAFNEIERQAKQRKESVKAAMLREEDDDIQDYKKPWVGLTDDEIDKAWRSVDYTVPWEQHRIDIARAIEAKLKEKNA